MRQILDHIYKAIFYNATKSYLKVVWHNNSHLMDDDDFQEIMLLYRSIVEKHHPQFVLVDTTDFHYTIAPEMQNLTNKHINMYLEDRVPVKRAVFVCSPDFFARLSIEQTVNEAEDDKRNKITFVEKAEGAEKYLFDVN